MTLTVYNISDDPRKLTKTLGEAVGEYTVNPTENCDILNPIVSVHSTGQGAFPLDANYATLSDTDRKYFIKDITLGTGGKVFVHLAVDVLGTYGTKIRDCNCTVTRFSKEKGKVAKPTYVQDGRYPLNSTKYKVVAQDFTNTPFIVGTQSIISKCYILTTMGSGNTIPTPTPVSPTPGGE